MANPNILSVSSIYGNTVTIIPGNPIFTGSITATTLTVNTISSGNVSANHIISGNLISTGTYIISQLTATNANTVNATFTQASTGANTIVLSAYQRGSNTSLVPGLFVLNVSGIPINTFVTAVNPSANTITISNPTTGAVSGTANLYSAGNTGTYSVNNSQTVPNTAITTVGAFWPILTPVANTVNKINNIVATNVTGTAATVTVSINSSINGGSASSNRLIYQLPVPVNAAVIVADKSTAFYLNETQSIVVSSGTDKAIEVTASYEAIT